MWFRPEPMYRHKECTHYDMHKSRCSLHKMTISMNEISCKTFSPRVASSYERFECKHCGAHGPKWHAQRVNTLYFENGNDAWVFKCGNCDKLTIIYQDEGHQRVKKFEADQTVVGQLKFIASNGT